MNRTERKESIARGIIAGGMARYGFDNADMCKLLSVSPNTWSKYMKNPSCISQGAIWVIVDMLKLTPPQAASLVMGRDLTAADFKNYLCS